MSVIEPDPDGTEFYCGLCGIIGEPLDRDAPFRYRCSECGRLTRFFPVPDWLESEGATVEERLNNHENESIHEDERHSEAERGDVPA